GATQLLIENSLFEHVRNPMIASEDESRIHQRGSLFDGTWGSHDDTGVDIDPADHYAYEPDPVEQVTELLTRHAGPSRRKESTGRQIRVAQDGSGDVASIHAAIGAALRADHDVEIIVAPGTYREAPVVWPGLDGLIIRGESEDPADVVLTYDKSAQDWATLTVLSSQVTLRALTLENTFEAPPGSGEALALRRMDDSTALEDVVVSGDEVVEDPRSGPPGSVCGSCSGWTAWSRPRPRTSRGPSRPAPSRRHPRRSACSWPTAPRSRASCSAPPRRRT